MQIRNATAKAVFTFLLTLPSVLLAEPGSNKGKGKGSDPVNKFQITHWEAADVTFADNANDAIQSDGLGPYETFADGFEAYSEYMLTAFIGGDRQFVLNLGTNVSGDGSIDPSGLIGDLSMEHRVQNVTIDDKDVPFPTPGTTLVSNPEHSHSIHFIFTAADGAGYAIAASDDTGLISLTAHDFDGDGVPDTRSISVASALVWTLYVQTTETREIVVGKGKNQTTETEEYTSYEAVADYTGMPLDMSFELLGFRVLQFGLR